MIIAAMIAYYVLAIGLIGGIAYLTYRQNARRSQALTDQLIARMQERFGNTPPLEPYVRDPLPDELPQDETEGCLIVSIIPASNAPAGQVADLSVRLIKALNKLAIVNGAAGLKAVSPGIRV